ncbi:LysM peptidoglycan-binding domain-containing protein [Kitasatospora mediocidica]|uniref:LysM peptidoglycan-binding domain-containing protein n=1 Tax=Kitasatospora mediocidica TaxID=58352 RepID=UPI0006903834|nr:LysM peptidoglycan-binding domain-containing protein [Kitasatospora mediocidica]
MIYGPAILMRAEAGIPGAVPFELTPDNISLAKEVRSHSHGKKKSGNWGTVFRRTEPTRITLSDVTLRGLQTKPLCDQLMNWMTPGGGLLGQMAGGAVAVLQGDKKGGFTNRLPTLLFQWGPPHMGFCYTVMLTGATIKFTRFNRDAIPIRAKVNLTMTEQPSLLGTLPTNPTSGGLPGRSSRTVTEGDDLPSLALAGYGSPGAWREVADANDIEDPLRIRPGQVLYLPNPDELSDR